MNGWTILRLAVVTFAFAEGMMNAAAWAPVQRVTPLLLIGMVCYGLIAVPLVVGLQRINPRAAPTWRYPSWSVNPLTMREPLQFFHMTGFFFLAAGAGVVAHELHDKRAVSLGSLFMPAVGLGVLTGVYVCTRLYRSKMEQKA